MPIQKAFRPNRGAGVLKSMQKGPALRPGVLTGVTPRRDEMRARRMDGLRQAANQIQPLRPGTMVRPANRPVRVMPGVPGQRPFQGAPAATSTAAANLGLNTGSITPELSAEVDALHRSLSDLQSRSLFGSIQSEISSLDKLINQTIELIESARQKGYVYQADIDGAVYDLSAQWQTLAPQLQSNVQVQAGAMQNRLMPISREVQRLNAVLHQPANAAMQLRSTQSSVNALLAEISRIESQVRGSFTEIDTQARKLNIHLTQIHWALDQLSQSKIRIAPGENLVMAVAARWDKEGKEDPEGVLYLTNRRMVFERKEKVATKKILFITTASELVQEVIIDQALSEVKGCQAENKGLFGHQDYLMVEFGAANLNHVALHINGQDAKDWATLVDRARSGQIESELAAVGAGVSMADLTRPLTRADLLGLQKDVNGLQDEVMFKDALQELAALENEVGGLERSLAGVRARGYQIEKNLEADLAILGAQWERIRTNAQATIDTQSRLLSEQMQTVQAELAQLMGVTTNLDAARPMYIRLRSSLASLDSQVEAAQATVLAQYDDYAEEVEGMAAHLEWVDWMLEALSTATFRLYAAESGIAAVEAVFHSPNHEPENGILFLTDQRILWEDRVGSYELKVNTPLDAVINVHQESNETEGTHILVFQLGAQAPLPVVRLELGLPVADEWIRMIGRARTGGYAHDMAVTLSPDELDRIRNAPQQCPKCGAAFTTPLLRGQTELRCEYCGLATSF